MQALRGGLPQEPGTPGGGVASTHPMFSALPVPSGNSAQSCPNTPKTPQRALRRRTTGLRTPEPPTRRPGQGALP